MRPSDIRGRRRHRGQAMVEMTLVIVVLLVVSFGMVDFGLFLTANIRATNCAREVARSAVVRKSNAATVCGSEQLTPLFESASISISPSNYANASAGTAVTATVTAVYRWKAIAPLINAFFPGTPWAATRTTTASSTMRLEGAGP